LLAARASGLVAAAHKVAHALDDLARPLGLALIWRGHAQSSRSG
jgi:hypothetical protein